MITSGTIIPPALYPLGRTRADTQGIQPVGLGKPSLDAVPFGAASTCRLHWQPECQQPLVQRSAGAIDRGCILEWGFGLGLHLRMAELLCSPVTFGLVAGMTREGQIGWAIAPATTAGNDMVDLPAIGGGSRLVAVRAAIAPLEQQILPDLGAGECPC